MPRKKTANPPKAKQPQFRIYYSDGSTYDGNPFEAPAIKVILILEHDARHGKRVLSHRHTRENGDYYCWDPELERWWAYDYPGLVQYLMEPGPRRVLLGQWIADDEWDAIKARAFADPDFAPQTARHSYEREAG